MNYQFAKNCQFDGPTLDKIYQDVFGYKTDGCFVEVGASNGEDYSNTSGLADIGWNGIYVEPVIELATKCQQRHANNKVTTVFAAAGSYNGFTHLYMIPEWGTATSNHEAAQSITRIDQVVFTSIVYRLDTILDSLAMLRGFDLLVIDVDYGEIEVLRGFDINFWKPKLVIIELHEDNPNQVHSEKVRRYAWNYFDKAGYKKIYKDFINTIYSINGNI